MYFGQSNDKAFRFFIIKRRNNPCSRSLSYILEPDRRSQTWTCILTRTTISLDQILDPPQEGSMVPIVRPDAKDHKEDCETSVPLLHCGGVFLYSSLRSQQWSMQQKTRNPTWKNNYKKSQHTKFVSFLDYREDQCPCKQQAGAWPAWWISHLQT